MQCTLGGGYDLELVRPESIQSLDEYLAQGVEYFVIRPDVFKTQTGEIPAALDLSVISDPIRGSFS